MVFGSKAIYKNVKKAYVSQYNVEKVIIQLIYYARIVSIISIIKFDLESKNVHTKQKNTFFMFSNNLENTLTPL